MLAERHVAQFVEIGALVLRHGITDGVVVESHVAHGPVAAMSVDGGCRQPERREHQLGRAGREDAEGVVVGGHRVLEPVDVRPPVVMGGPSLGRVDEVEDLLVVTSPFGQFPVVVAESDSGVSPDVVLHGRVGVEEPASSRERRCDQIVESMALEEEEAMVATRAVQFVQRGGAGIRDVDDGHQIHARTVGGAEHRRKRYGASSPSHLTVEHDDAMTRSQPQQQWFGVIEGFYGDPWSHERTPRVHRCARTMGRRHLRLGAEVGAPTPRRVG